MSAARTSRHAQGRLPFADATIYASTATVTPFIVPGCSVEWVQLLALHGDLARRYREALVAVARSPGGEPARRDLVQASAVVAHALVALTRRALALVPRQADAPQP